MQKLKNTIFMGEKISHFFNKERKLLAGSVLEYLAVAVGYLIVIMLFTGTLFANLSSQIYAGPGDATTGFLWINETDNTLNPFVSDFEKTDYPHGESNSGFTLISYIAYWMPMRLISFLTNPIMALNIIMIIGYLFTAMAVYLVVKRLAKRKMIAFTAGFAAAFVPYALIKSSGHISYIFGGVYALIVGAFISFWITPSWRRAVVVGLLLGLTIYIDGYFILISAVLGVALLSSALVYGLISKHSLKQWISRLKLGLLAIGVFAVMTMPLLATNAIYGKDISSGLSANRSNIENEIREYRSHVIDFITPQKGSLLWENNEVHEYLTVKKNQRSNASENTNFIAITMYIVIGVGTLLYLLRLLAKKYSSLNLKTRQTNAVGLTMIICVITAAASLSIMFSPEVYIFGILVPLPGALFIEYNIEYWRVMSRLFVLYNIAIVLWFSVALWVMHECMSRLRNNASKIVGIIMLAIISLLVILEYITLFPSRPYDFSKAPKTYSWLAERDDIDSIAMLPLVDPLDNRAADYLTAQIVHGKSIVNKKTADTERLNNTLGSNKITEETINFLRERNVDAVLYFEDNGQCEQPEIGKVIYTERLKRYDVETKAAVQSTLCTILADKIDRQVDPVYAVFTEGFSPSPNASDQSDIAFRAGGKGTVRLVREDLKTPYFGNVELRAYIRLIPEIAGVGWKIIQGNVVIESGEFHEDRFVSVDAIVRGDTPVVIKVESPTGELNLADVYLEQVVASALTKGS